MSEFVIKDKFIYSLADKRYYETLTRYQAQHDDFCLGLKRRLPQDWVMQRHELWMHCMPPQYQYPDQGWKIHLSATPAHAPAILNTAAAILVQENVPFKFVADKMLLSLSLGKRWSRGAAGKFMAIYPKDAEQCERLLEALHQATIGFHGPYILSDRRYKDSKVVYYRYGGLRSTRRIGTDGSKTHVILDQDGNYVRDERTPFFNLPAGVVDPFQQDQHMQDGGEEGTLKKGRYKIDSVLAYSNSGGVYLATDRVDGQRVVIKEARPFTNVSTRGLDAVQLLKKEHRILSCLNGLDIAPQTVDFFFDWEHAYLVETYLDGARDFRSYMGAVSLSLRTRPEPDAGQKFFTRFCEVFRQLTAIVQELHRRHIVFGDLSMANVMISAQPDSDAIKVRLIDFEGAHEAQVDLAAHLFTPGFSPDEFGSRGVTSSDDDLYALGALMMAGLFPMNMLLTLDRSAHKRFLDAMSADFGLPARLRQVIEGLMSPRDQRPALAEVAQALAEPYSLPAPVIRSDAFSTAGAHAMLEQMMRYIDSTADFERYDRLFPADPEVFSSNPLSLAHGACGIALVQHRVRGRVDSAVLDWIKRIPLKRDAYSPGLYSGLSGIAWFWLELGEEERARATLALAEQHPYLKQSADVYHGAAGWGMTQLRFFEHFREPQYLAAAVSAGEYLLQSREAMAEGQCAWRTPLGLSASYAHGAAGISAFLLYLHLATGRADFLLAGEEGLAWVIAGGVGNEDGGLSWLARDTTPSLTPYWRWGSSGIARTLLRYWHVTGKEEYAAIIDRAIIDADRKYAIYPGYFFGLAGIAELFLDLTRFERWREQAESSVARLFSGVMLYALEEEAGTAFPGESLGRISCDFGTGSAGTALVLHRHLTRCGPSLMVDSLLPGWPAEDR
ncbi:class III lanthionine synthetase LanKC [Pseudoduganella sp. R-34]|uniref:class III lanthionine synthetase LanKC n=1 Tax=Pseudoduganella sp. R-34 TaxID=3404062 RepID=UPI003CF1767B